METQNPHQENRTVGGGQVCLRVLSPSPAIADSRINLPILLLHGLGCSGDAWGPLLHCLAKKRLGQPVFVPDLPGYGHSQGPREALGMDALADWTVLLLDSLELARVHVAGNSMGCQVALAVARRHPERVGALVLLGPTTGRHWVPFWRYMAGLFIDSFREPLAYNLVLLHMYAEMGMQRYLETVAKMMEDDPVAGAASVKAPCLIMRGGRDAIVPDVVARRLTVALPQGSFTRVESLTHALQFNAPETFAPLALDYWARAESLVCL